MRLEGFSPIEETFEFSREPVSRYGYVETSLMDGRYCLVQARDALDIHVIGNAFENCLRRISINENQQSRDMHDFYHARIFNREAKIFTVCESATDTPVVVAEYAIKEKRILQTRLKSNGFIDGESAYYPAWREAYRFIASTDGIARTHTLTPIALKPDKNIQKKVSDIATQLIAATKGQKEVAGDEELEAVISDPDSKEADKLKDGRKHFFFGNLDNKRPNNRYPGTRLHAISWIGRTHFRHHQFEVSDVWSPRLHRAVERDRDTNSCS